MELDKLKAVLQPPSKPQEVMAGEEAWESVEERLGTRLPSDYKKFIETYGTGTIDNFLLVLNPFSSNTFLNLIEASHDREGLATLRQEYPQLYVHDRYPAPGGLLPFASTDNGNILYWRTAGKTDHWTVVVYESRGPEYYGFNGPMTDFLAALLSRAIQCDVFPQSFLHDQAVFTPVQIG